jgi:hypothetical protein
VSLFTSYDAAKKVSNKDKSAKGSPPKTFPEVQNAVWDRYASIVKDIVNNYLPWWNK